MKLFNSYILGEPEICNKQLNDPNNTRTDREVVNILSLPYPSSQATTKAASTTHGRIPFNRSIRHKNSTIKAAKRYVNSNESFFKENFIVVDDE